MSMVKVLRFTGRCPIGGCSKAKTKDHMGISYEDAGCEVRRKVYNHVRYSPQHEYKDDPNGDDLVNELLDADVEKWLTQSTQHWTSAEWNEYNSHDRADENEQDEAAAESRGVPEPAGFPSKKARARPSYRPMSYDRSRSRDRRSRSRSRPRTATPETEGASQIIDKLEEQIKRQTQNMLHFTKAASTCISALKVAADMSREAARVFDTQRQAVEEGLKKMIDSFGLEPQRNRRRHHAYELTDRNTAIDLARAVRRK